MPSANGVYSLPPGYLAVTGATILASQHNPIFEDVAAALTLRLSRDGTAPMTGAVQLSSGTVTAPGAVFSVDLSSGFYKTTTGIGVAIGGVQIAEFTAAGMASGNRLLGELVPYTGSTVPSSLWALPNGQTLSRTTYAALWTFAQTEIAAGNTFYNNGDGATTFGIGDARGRTFACLDNMGGMAAGRLTPGGSGVTGTVIGSCGGSENEALSIANINPFTPTGSVSTSTSVSGTIPIQGATGSPLVSAAAWGRNDTGIDSLPFNSVSASSSSTFTGNSLGSGIAHANVQPTMVLNCIMFAGGMS
jgi:microcystin-dependent protein